MRPDDHDDRRRAEVEAWQRAFLDDEGALTTDGRLMLADVERFCHALERLDVRSQDGRVDPLSMAILEGRRQFALWLRLSRLRVSTADLPGEDPHGGADGRRRRGLE